MAKRYIEVPATAGVKLAYFQQDNVLQNVPKVKSIEAFRVGKVALSPTTGATVIPDVVFNKAFLTLVKKNGTEEISKIPLSLICREDNNGIVENIDITDINITKCYIEVPEVTGVVTGNVYFLVVNY